MARPTKHEQMDEGAYVPHAAPDQLIAPAWSKEVQIDEVARKNSLKLLATAHHRVPNGYRDPLTILMIVDLLERWSPAYYIRAKYVARYLNEKQSNIYFEPRTVGRILNEITEIAAESYASRPELQPIVVTRDYQNNIYFINSTPTTYAWLWNIRTELDAKVRKMIELEAHGLPFRSDSLWAEIDTTAIIA